MKRRPSRRCLFQCPADERCAGGRSIARHETFPRARLRANGFSHWTAGSNRVAGTAARTRLEAIQKGVGPSVPVVMVGHVAVGALDPGVPSSLLPASYGALRDMGFDGVAVTDAINMGAIEQLYPEAVRLRRWHSQPVPICC